MEAEAVPVVSPWVVEVKRDKFFSREAYIRFDGNGHYGGPPSGTLSFFFEIYNPGTYIMSMRTYRTKTIQPSGTTATLVSLTTPDTKTMLSRPS
jgi:hypothetical protein